MLVTVELLKIKTHKALQEEFTVVWVRGPQQDTTIKHNFFVGEKEKKINDKFSRVSGFKMDKHGNYLEKKCDFRIMVGKVIKSTVTFDMSKQVGSANKPLEIEMSEGFSI